MKQNVLYDTIRLLSLILLLFCGMLLPCKAIGQVRYISSIPLNPSDIQNCMVLDNDGEIWAGSEFGLAAYDGYRFSSFRNTPGTPDIFPSNSIMSLAKGKDGSLWIGTRNGLVKRSQATGHFTTMRSKDAPKGVIYALYVSSDGTLWIGNDDGLTSYTDGRGFHHYRNIPSVKSFAEDKDGSLYIGTWDDCLFRLDRTRRQFHRYAVWGRKERMTAYSLALDGRGRLWIGTWGKGIKCLLNPRSTSDPQLINIPGESNSIIYAMAEDPLSHNIIYGKRDGIGVISPDMKVMPPISVTTQGLTHPAKGAIGIRADGKGNVWVLTRFDGILHFTTLPPPFQVTRILEDTGEMTCVRSIYTVDGDRFVLTFFPMGIALYDRRSGKMTYGNDFPMLAEAPYVALHTMITDIKPRSKEELWLAVKGYGVIVAKQGHVALLNKYGGNFLKTNFVNGLLRYRDGTMFAAGDDFVSWLLPSGKSGTIRNNTDNVSAVEDASGNVWIATRSRGVLRLNGDFRRPQLVRQTYYEPEEGHFKVSNVTQCFVDSHNRLWAASANYGLFLYDKAKDRFVSTNDMFHLRIGRVFSINEDCTGNLWLATDGALARLSIDDKGNCRYTSFTSQDGLGDIIFQERSTYRLGDMLYFGSGKNLVSISPSGSPSDDGKCPYKLIVSDLYIEGQTIEEADSALRLRICNSAVRSARELVIPSSVSKFSIEFALLSYMNVGQCKYAYRLDGYNKGWQYVDAADRRATFENMPANTYKLHVKAADSYGRWTELPYTITIRVLPPWYATWWAWTIYLLVAIGIIYIAMRMYQHHIKTRNRLQMQVIFTNITHELLTPLSVISAAADNIVRQHGDAGSNVGIIKRNVAGMTRMLRQILEVRKAQAGRLYLHVSEGDLGDFCRNACQSLLPMFDTMHLTFTDNISCVGQKVWFDKDKVRKILYNLLSNSAKYNKEQGEVRLSVSIDHGKATLVVADTGIGIDRNKRCHLYGRFLDGYHPNAGSMGTGIGLSFIHDLVVLHHGTIDCETKVGKGTTFTVVLPVERSDFKEEELEQRVSWDDSNQKVELGILPKPVEEDATAPTEAGSRIAKNAEYSVLIVEDNAELLTLMRDMLSAQYNVHTALNGERAQKIIETTPLDIVITDVMMPVMDGMELTKWIKNHEDYAQLPVIMLTAKTQDAERQEGYKAGADEYIRKPFSINDLQLRIDNIIGNRERIRKRFQQQTDFRVEEQHYSSPEEIFMRKVWEKVIENIGNTDYGREQLAADMNVSSSTLYNKLRATTGQNIVSFINTVRMKEACRILKAEPDIRVNELAYRVGFSTRRYFSLCFKKEFGMTVTEYVAKQNDPS